MRGELSILIPKMVNKDCPVEKEIGKHSIQHIVEVICEEYEKEWVRKLERYEQNTILRRGLGVWFTKMSPLKRYIRKLIYKIRKSRAIIERETRIRENFNPENSKTVMMERLYILKLKAALIQLDTHRKIIILKTIRWNDKKRELGEQYKIRFNYEVNNFSFVPKKLSNDVITYEDLVKD